MRPIKFRAWYERSDFEHDENFMMNVYKIEYFGSEIEINEGYLIDEFKNVTNSTYAPAKLFLMQYTGLKDKNGVEIYEGDIVNITQYFGGHPYGEIERVIKRSEYNNDLIADSESGDWRTPEVRMSFRSSDDYEVIGNIYQNPELIKNET